ncbi:hypothetical protein PQQ51_33480 [Paraburkholderia xenovorans]|uniref:hypothetical protein n=1 Tax=Paraburkholderia xenovorans TaxID=36873 RepID=UPI0038B8EAC1
MDAPDLSAYLNVGFREKLSIAIDPCRGADADIQELTKIDEKFSSEVVHARIGAVPVFDILKPILVTDPPRFPSRTIDRVLVENGAFSIPAEILFAEAARVPIGASRLLFRSHRVSPFSVLFRVCHDSINSRGHCFVNPLALCIHFFAFAIQPVRLREADRAKNDRTQHDQAAQKFSCRKLLRRARGRCVAVVVFVHVFAPLLFSESVSARRARHSTAS